MTIRVLIGFAEALAAPEAVFDLQAAGYDVHLFSRNGTVTSAARLVPATHIVEIPAPEASADAAIAALDDAFDKVDAVLALDDAALWLTDAVALKRDSRAIPAMASATGAQAHFALDKRLQIEAASAAGFAVPPTTLIETDADLNAPDTVPAIIKAALAGQLVDGGLTRGGAAYLENAADRAADFLLPALRQPLIQGTGEGLFGFATAAGTVVCWSAHRRIRMMNPHGSGASACRSIPVDASLRECGERLIAQIGWRGPFMIELLRSEGGSPLFMEFNGRLWGSTALARRRGFNHPVWAVAQALDPGFMPTEPPVTDHVTVRHLGRELLHLLFVARGPRSVFHRTNWPRLWPTLRAVLTPTPRHLFYNTDPSRPWFFISDAARTIHNFARKARS